MGALMSELPQERADDRPSLDRIGAKGVRYHQELCPERNAFGQPIGAFQNTRFKLADLKSDYCGRMGLCRPVSARHVRGEPHDLRPPRPQSYGPLRCTDASSISACNSSRLRL